MSRIDYSNTTIFGKMTAETINDLLNSISTLARLKNTMDQAVGTVPDWTQLEAGNFGVSTGNGQAFYNAIVALQAAVATVTPANINILDMGG